MRYLIRGINPVPWMSPQGSVGRKNGKMFVHMHSPTELKNYQAAVREALEGAPPVEGDNISLTFYFWRNARTKHDHQADATNLQKATEDALQGVLFANDRDVQHVQSWIVAQGADVEPQILVSISRNRQIPNLDDLTTAWVKPEQDYQHIQHIVPEPDSDFVVEDYF
jgi:Holliday junction resolvase RusA-like endonuclease